MNTNLSTTPTWVGGERKPFEKINFSIPLFRRDGRWLPATLRDSKNKRLLPFSHSLAELAHTSPEAGRCAALESQATDIYQLARPVIGQGESDFRRKIVTSGGSHHAEEEK